MANIELKDNLFPKGLQRSYKNWVDELDYVKDVLKKIQGQLNDQVEAKKLIDDRFERIQKLLKKEIDYLTKAGNLSETAIAEFEQIDKQQANVFSGTEKVPTAASAIKDVITKNYVSKYGSMSGFLLAAGSALTMSDLSKWNTKMNTINKNMQATTADIKKQTQKITKETNKQSTTTNKTPSSYEEYRKQVNALNKNKSIPVQKQLHEVYLKDGKYKKVKNGGRCNVASVQTLLNRKLAYDGKDNWFTAEDVFTSNGCTVKESGVTWTKDNPNSGYVYDGNTNNWSTKKYTNADGTVYQMVSETAKTVEKNMKKAGITDYYAYVASLLDKHPEGICIRNIEAAHVAVITDYEIINGKIQLYVSDPVQVVSGKNRVKLEDSYIYKNSPKNDIFSRMENIAYIG